MQPETNLRFSDGRTLARPTFREFAPLATFAFPGEFDQLGNPNLTRTLIDNLDLRWETYPRRGEYLGISAFYKYFTDPIENTVNPDAGGSSREYRYENVDKGLIIGAEIEFKKSLDFISPGLENFKISTNLTYIYSEVSLEADELEAIRAFNPDAKETRDMYNQSPFVINANLLYNSEKSGLSSNVSFNVFGQRLTVFQTDLPFIYEQPRPDLNFSIKKKFGNHTSVRFRADNLLNPDYKHTIDYNGTEYIYNSFSLGRSFSLSFTYLIE
jgi:outer membrane receptor protein involved in Fe transport